MGKTLYEKVWAQGWIDLPRGALAIKDRAPLQILASSDEG